jgi:radical SAM enzyme (TIGR04100 family)
MTITYPVKNGIYVNMTNKCPCNCTFCIRHNGPGAYGSDSLWLEREPSVDEVCESLKQWDLDKKDEIVFCGYGEPTERLDDLLLVAAWIKENYSIPVRINTNGLSDLINGRDTAPELKGLIDAVSISLNANDPEAYLKITQSKFGIGSWQAMIDFAKNCAAYVPKVTMTVVDQVTTPEEQEEAKRICESIGARLRIRPLIS